MQVGQQSVESQGLDFNMKLKMQTLDSNMSN